MKRALTVALGPYDCQRFGSIARNCYSIAFFGTPRKFSEIQSDSEQGSMVPDYGSTALSDGACKDDIRRILDLPYPYRIRLREQFRMPEDLDHMLQFSRKFAPLTLGLANIWSFFEEDETAIAAKMKSPNSSRITETKLSMPVSLHTQFLFNRLIISNWIITDC